MRERSASRTGALEDRRVDSNFACSSVVKCMLIAFPISHLMIQTHLRLIFDSKMPFSSFDEA